ncbi:hypothetical protein ABZ858_28985 [Streptomyces sp. NPDC047017]|uniref:hypothetical protein n=1 Tax=Streptomyces sp. NPDC047017 TaxID=3155024 RepID=UPI0033E0BEBD
MSGTHSPADPREPRTLPAVGTLMVDAGRDDAIGEFRGVAGPYWSLRPVCGGAEWEAEPARVRLANDAERLRAGTARANARSRGEIL